MTDDDESKNCILLIPHQNDVVAVRHSGDDYRIGITSKIDKLPQVNVKILIHGKTEEPLIHSNNSGLLFRDGPQPTKADLMHEEKRSQILERKYLVSNAS